MTEDAVFSCNDSSVNCQEETLVDVGDLNKKLVELTRENDNQKQQIYDLQRKLEVQKKFNEELIEDSEISTKLLKTDHQKKIKELTDLSSNEKERHKNDIDELEKTLAEIKQQLLNSKKEVENLKLETGNYEKNQDSILQATENEEKLRAQQQIQELASLLENEMTKNDNLKSKFESLREDHNNLQELFNVSKQNSQEQKQLLENVREELLVCQSELNYLKSAPSSDSSKGNSVFAELEDSRNKVVMQMNKLKGSYQEMRRNYKILESQNAVLKSEKVKLMREWSEESVAILVKKKELDDSYNETIRKLQQSLNNERKTLQEFMEAQLQNPNASFLQIQLAEQKQEMDRLRSELENDYYQKCLLQQQLEQSLKEVRFWKYKALAVTEATEIDALLQSQSNDLKHTLSEEDKLTDVLPTKKSRTTFADNSLSKRAFENRNVPSKTVTFMSSIQLVDEEDMSLTCINYQ